LVAAAAPDPVSNLPSGYPVYCIYFPSGWGTEPEQTTLDALKQWGTSMGKNLYVASWDIGDPAYRDISNKIGLTNVPAVVLTDTAHPDKSSFLIKLDDPKLVSNLDDLRPVLTMILQHLLLGEEAEVLKDLMRSQNEKKIRDFVESALHGLSFNATVNLGVFSVQVSK
jgi:hypothetical protein